MRIIRLRKETEKNYCADPTWLPGSPYVGRGITQMEALISLLNTLGLEVEIEEEENKEQL